MAATTTDRWVRDRLMLALYNAGFTLTEIGQRFGGITRERVRQRLAFMPGYRGRIGAPPAQGPTTPAWQARYAQDLCDTGAQKSVVLWLLSMEPWNAKAVVSRTSGAGCSRNSKEFRTEYARAIFVGLKYSLLIHAWKHGASTKDLAKIFGTTSFMIGRLLSILRAEGHDLRRLPPPPPAWPAQAPSSLLDYQGAGP